MRDRRFRAAPRCPATAPRPSALVGDGSHERPRFVRCGRCRIERSNPAAAGDVSAVVRLVGTRCARNAFRERSLPTRRATSSSVSSAPRRRPLARQRSRPGEPPAGRFGFAASRRRRARAPRNDPRRAAMAPARRPLHARERPRGSARCRRGTCRSRPHVPRAAGEACRRGGRRLQRRSGVSSQQLLQVGQRVKEVRLDRADRTAEDSGDLLVRQIMINAKDQRRALLWRQPRMAARTSAARSSRSTRIRASTRFDASPCRALRLRGVLSARRLRQTLTAIRYSQVTARLPLESLAAP